MYGCLCQCILVLGFIFLTIPIHDVSNVALCMIFIVTVVLISPFSLSLLHDVSNVTLSMVLSVSVVLVSPFSLFL